MQEKICRLSKFGKQGRLQISERKSEIMTLNVNAPAPVLLKDQALPSTETFTYLGSVVRHNGGTNEDIHSRLRKARNAFRSQNAVWRSPQYNIKTKRKLENLTHLLAMNHLQPLPPSTAPAGGYGDHHNQEAMVLDWARAAQGCQLHHQGCNPLDPRGKAEAWSTKDNLAKNCGSGNEEHEPQLRNHPEAGQ